MAITFDRIIGYKIKGEDQVFPSFKKALKETKHGDHIIPVTEECTEVTRCGYCDEIEEPIPQRGWHCPYCGSC